MPKETVKTCLWSDTYTFDIIPCPGFYMVYSSNFGQLGDKVAFTSTKMTISTPTTFNFSYYLDSNVGETPSKLEVFQTSPLHVRGPSLFFTGNSTGGAWIVASICLTPGDTNLTFVATQGQPFSSTIAIDALMIVNTTADQVCETVPDPKQSCEFSCRV